MEKKIIVAIDGYSSSGKSTMAKELAGIVGYRYIDSGAMYRAVTLYALDNGLIAADGSIDTAALERALPDLDINFSVGADGKSRTMLNGVDVETPIRDIRVADHVSPIAALPAVRHRLTAMQQAFGREKGIVMDGRDIGTTVFPQAELKVFVDASPQTRAQRRFDELQAAGRAGSYDEVLANICERDRIDRTRKESPLRQAADAIALNNDRMTRAEQMRWLLDKFNAAAGTNF